MQISQRQEQIIEKLSFSNLPLTAQQLSKELGVSTKTVRNDIQQLNGQAEQTVILSKAGAGFYLNPDTISLLKKEKTIERSNLHFELLVQIIDQESCDFYELADDFFISESALNRIIKELNDLISRQDQSLIIQRKNNRLFIDGEEAEKRRVFTLFLNQEIEANKLSLEKYSGYFGQIDLGKLSQIVIRYHQQEEFSINDFSTISFILHIAVLLERVSKASFLNTTRPVMEEPESRRLTRQLAELLEKEFQVNIPEEELPYIYRLYSGAIISSESLEELQLKETIASLLESVTGIFYLDFTQDEKIVDYLLTHVSALYKRAINHQYLTNPLLEEIKSKFPFVYNVSVYASAYLQNTLNIQFPEDEIAYLSLHFLSALENIRSQKKKQVLLVSPYGVGNQRMVRAYLNRIKDFEIEMSVAKSVFDVNDKLVKDKDLILTSESLHLETSIPIYHYQSFLTEKDLAEITQIFVEESQTPSVLNKFLEAELFFPQQSQKSPEEVISFLCQQLYDKGYCEADYVDKVLERESLSSTAFGNYYAIPHAIKREAKKNAVAICSFDKPIQWQDKKVKLVLLLALKGERDNSFEQLFEELVMILNEPARVKRLAKQTNFEEFLAICQEK
ncbi:BglG family transcription antiterminator [Enterococcus sp. AZ109]|uniref:BglG family transcription antiterminator n=1 Tax=Enterococcus sp. AZ109 TaxID=2774634 RepID=UPI003F21E7EF